MNPVLTKAQQKRLSRISDGEWHTFKGHSLAMCHRLMDMGLIELEYLPGGAMGMPNWFRIRKKASVPKN